jgi:hypothetical protein
MSHHWPQVREVPDSVLFTVERALLGGVGIAATLWVLAGAGTAYEAYMVATKRTVSTVPMHRRNQQMSEKDASFAHCKALLLMYSNGSGSGGERDTERILQ